MAAPAPDAGDGSADVGEPAGRTLFVQEPAPDRPVGSVSPNEAFATPETSNEQPAFTEHSVYGELTSAEIEQARNVFTGRVNEMVDDGIAHLIAADLHQLEQLDPGSPEYQRIRENMIDAMRTIEEGDLAEIDESHPLLAKYFEGQDFAAVVDVESDLRGASGASEVVEIVNTDVVRVPPYGAVSFEFGRNGEIVDWETNMKLRPFQRRDAREIISVDWDMGIGEIRPGWAHARKVYGEELFKIRATAEALKDQMGADYFNSPERKFLRERVQRMEVNLSKNGYWNGRIFLNSAKSSSFVP